MKKIVLLFLLISFSFSCSLEKRHYRNGYALSWNKKQVEHSKTHNLAVKDDDKIANPLDLNSETSTTASIEYQGKEHILTGIIIPEKRNIFAVSCDTIFLKGGGRMLAKSIQVVGSEIKYKACDDEIGEELSLQKSEVDNIHHADGGRDYFYSEVPATRNPPGSGRNGNPNNGRGGGYTTTPNNNPDLFQNNFSKPAKNSLILGILCLIPTFFIGGVLAVCAITTGRTARRRIKASGATNKAYDDKAKTGIILGIVGIALRALIILLAIVLTIGLL